MKNISVHPDNILQLAVICFLGVGGTLGLIGLMLLSYSGRPTPEGIATIVAACYAGMTSLLINNKRDQRAPGAMTREADAVPVEVVNEPSNAVPVERAQDTGD